MANAASRLSRTFVVLGVTVLAIFGTLVFGLTIKLRGRLRGEVLQREAEAIHAVALMQISALPSAATHDTDPTLGLFTAVLESSRLRGVLAVQLFDPNGVLRVALPQTEASAGQPQWWGRRPTGPAARFVPHGTLEEVYGFPTEPGSKPTQVPLLDVAVPLHGANTGAALAGVAHYWIDGRAVSDEFQRMDRGLAAQAGWSFLGGGLLVVLALAWAFRPLQRANQRLIEQSADLARANHELDFAAKTGALGAISAHLIHGLKNPLAGLEGFVAESGATDGAERGEAWQTAVETTRRLRAMVNDVMTVLSDESPGRADYVVPVDEIVAAAIARTAAATLEAGVEVRAAATSAGTVKARTANLAGLVLANLIGNAIDASGRGKCVTVEARAAGDTVEFLVGDAGPGIPPEIRQALFRPLKSSKPGGGGMGLAISHRLAKHAGGDLDLLSSSTQGTVFRLRVPALPR